MCRYRQEGLCAICHQMETVIMRGNLKLLSVDHNHTTGAIRGLLCTRCNFLVDLAERYTDADIAEARAYLQAY